MNGIFWTFYIYVVNPLISFYLFVIIAGVVISWLLMFNVINPRHPVAASLLNAIYMLTEPVYRPIRNILPTMGGLDLSPLIVFLGLQFLNAGLIRPFFYFLATGRWL